MPRNDTSAPTSWKSVNEIAFTDFYSAVYTAGRKDAAETEQQQFRKRRNKLTAGDQNIDTRRPADTFNIQQTIPSL